MTFGERVVEFNLSLKLRITIPDVEVLNPYKDPYAVSLAKQFYNKYYGDTSERHIILGINPGRFGSGLTGVPFTDPVKMETLCAIPNSLPKKAELSANFIYTMIKASGGPEKFYKRFYIHSVCPLGFTREGKNLNYYDIRELQNAVEPFIIKSIKTQLTFGIPTNIGYCLGEGHNFKYLSHLNEKHKFFKKIIPLSHPRFIMQYKRKSINAYVEDYLRKFKQAEGEE
jgi:hypothetical protein